MWQTLGFPEALPHDLSHRELGMCWAEGGFPPPPWACLGPLHFVGIYLSAGSRSLILAPMGLRGYLEMAKASLCLGWPTLWTEPAPSSIPESHEDPPISLCFS